MTGGSVAGDRPLEPDGPGRAAIADAAFALVDRFAGAGGTVPPGCPRRLPDPGDLGRPPAAGPREIGQLLDVVAAAAAHADDTTSPRTFAYFPGGGLFSSAVAEMVGRVLNRYTGSTGMAEELVELEDGALRWFAGVLGMPAGAGGMLTTGASTGLLSVVAAARDAAPGPIGRAVVYVTDQTHHSVAKAARIAGLGADQVREVATDDRWRLRPDALRAAVRADRAAGRSPALIVATAGSTNTGTIDPLDRIADVAEELGVWWHVDAAYGGGFALTDRGRDRLRGIGRADSVTVDGHKSLFLPYTTGLLLLREPRRLLPAHGGTGAYLQDLDRSHGLPEYGDMGPELSREFRGLRLWLPLHLHGTDAFRAALDEKLDLSALVDTALRREPDIESGPPPDLTVNVFAPHGGEQAARAMLHALERDGRARLTSTRVRGRFLLRMCVLNHRTAERHVRDAIEAVRAAAGAGGAPRSEPTAA